MVYLNLIEVIAALTFMTGVTAQNPDFLCDGSGPQWNNKNEVLLHIRNACYGYDGIQGHYQNVRNKSPYNIIYIDYSTIGVLQAI